MFGEPKSEYLGGNKTQEDEKKNAEHLEKFSPTIETTVCGIKAKVHPNGVKMSESEMMDFIEEIANSRLGDLLTEWGNKLGEIDSSKFDDENEVQNFSDFDLISSDSITTDNYHVCLGYIRGKDSGEIRSEVTVNRKDDNRGVRIQFVK